MRISLLGRHALYPHPCTLNLLGRHALYPHPCRAGCSLSLIRTAAHQDTKKHFFTILYQDTPKQKAIIVIRARVIITIIMIDQDKYYPMLQ